MDRKRIFILLGAGIGVVAVFIVIIVTMILPAFRTPQDGNIDGVNTPINGQLPSTNGGFNGSVNQPVNGQLPNSGGVAKPDKPQGPPPDIDRVANGDDTLVGTVVDAGGSYLASGSGGGLGYYNGSDGKFYRILPDGTPLLLSSEEFSFVQKVVWSQDGNKVIMTFPDNRSLFVDFRTGEKVPLPASGRDFVFQGNTTNVVFQTESGDPDQNFIVVSDLQGRNAQAVEHVGDRGATVQTTYSPGGDFVALHRKQTSGSSEEIYFIGQNQENFKSMKVNGFGFRGKWVSGGRLLYSVISASAGYAPSLWIADATPDTIGLNSRSLTLPVSVDDCVVNQTGTVAYCAVPTEIPEGAGLYPELFVEIPRRIFEVNINTGIPRLIASPVLSDGSSDIPMDQLALSQDETQLYFRNPLTGGIYSVRLR